MIDQPKDGRQANQRREGEETNNSGNRGIERIKNTERRNRGMLRQQKDGAAELTLILV